MVGKDKTGYTYPMLKVRRGLIPYYAVNFNINIHLRYLYKFYFYLTDRKPNLCTPEILHEMRLDYPILEELLS